jgi:hypothetical protein
MTKGWVCTQPFKIVNRCGAADLRPNTHGRTNHCTSAPVTFNYRTSIGFSLSLTSRQFWGQGRWPESIKFIGPSVVLGHWSHSGRVDGSCVSGHADVLLACQMAQTRLVIAELLKVMAALLVLGVIGYFVFPRLVCVDTPKRQKLADCNTNALAFTITIHHSPPYQFVLGLEPSHTGPFASTGTVAAIQIDSEHITSCGRGWSGIRGAPGRASLFGGWSRPDFEWIQRRF